MKYDVVIIGAGPGGVSAAHNFINNNVSCILIDKQKFPRNKLCAGGITNKTFELMKNLKLQEEFDVKTSVVSEGASLYLEYSHIADIISKGLTYLVDRFEFDDYLVNQYKQKGGNLLEGRKVINIDTENNIIILDGGEVIKFKYIVGADGVVGITKGLVDENVKANGFCLQVEIDREQFNYESNNMSLYYGVIPQGYGWIFPKKKTLTVGFGGDYHQDLNYHEEFAKFLNKLNIDYDKSEFRGAMIPFGDYVKNPINKSKNLLLVGDAAGLVDPITGEGIYYAMLSGIKASNIIMKALKENNKDEVDKYIDEISEITRNISKGTKLKKLIYKYRKLIFNAMKNKKIGNFLFNECLYSSNYDLLEVLFHKNNNA